MNEAIFYFFYNLAHQYQWLDHLLVFLAVYLPYVFVFSVGLFLLFHHEVFKMEHPFLFFLRRKREILLLSVSGGSAYILALILKNLFQMGRPVLMLPGVEPLILKTSFSFPSEHATFFMALALAIFFLHKKVGSVFLFLALIIGLARIATGVHFPIDILGGFILGAVIAFLIKVIWIRKVFV